MHTSQPLAFVRGKVVTGFGRGSRELGCPTANIDNIDNLTLPTGIYCGLCKIYIDNLDEIQRDTSAIDQKCYEETIEKLPFETKLFGMVCSFGYNPQYGNKEKSLEVHVIENLNFNFYGARMKVLICKKLRDEEKYNSLDELKSAIARDIRNAKNEIENFTGKQYFDAFEAC